MMEDSTLLKRLRIERDHEVNQGWAFKAGVSVFGNYKPSPLKGKEVRLMQHSANVLGLHV